MIIRLADEEILHKHKAKMKKFGKGVFYITSHRLCFEANDKGVCFDLGLNYLWNWNYKERNNKITLRWLEPKPGSQVNVQDKKFEVEVEFDLKDEKLESVKEVHYELYYAKTGLYKHGATAMGFWMDEKDRIFNHYFCNEKKPIKQGYLFANEIRGKIIEEQEKYLKNATGETSLDQVAFERITMLKAEIIESDVWLGGDRPKVSYKDLTDKEWYDCSISDEALERNNSHLTRMRREIEEFIAKENRKELNKYMPPCPGRRFWNLQFKGGSRRDFYEYCENAHKILIRTSEITKNMRFKSRGAWWGYWNKLNIALVEKFLKDGDIKDYNPDIPYVESLLIEAQEKVKAYKEKFVPNTDF